MENGRKVVSGINIGGDLERKSMTLSTCLLCWREILSMFLYQAVVDGYLKVGISEWVLGVRAGAGGGIEYIHILL